MDVLKPRPKLDINTLNSSGHFLAVSSSDAEVFKGGRHIPCAAGCLWGHKDLHGPTSGHVPARGACLVARGHPLLRFLHNLSDTKVHTIKRICWIQGLAFKLQY